MMGKQRLVLVGAVTILAFSITLLSASTSYRVVNADNEEARIAILETTVSRQNTQLDQLQTQIDSINVALSLPASATEIASTQSGRITFHVNGNAMAPTFHDDQIVIVDLEAYKKTSPQRGDVIVFNPPVSSGSPYIKRVIGVAGDEVEIRTDGSVYLNDQRLEEPYLSTQSTTCLQASCDPVFIPDGELYVMGDNRANSSDSRIFGTVSVANVIGKVILD